ncbi:SRPBCC family protein [Nocardioides marmorisolisilvae]|nr:SRPBCC family protein [Nocardioides marmorisolisilvae]
MSDAAARELRAETTIAAPPAQVWAALTDLRNMRAWSEELVTMIPLTPGGLKLGQQYLGLNRRKAMIWPSRSVVAQLDAEKALAWDTKTSGARWIYELSPEGTGTKVVHRRPVPKKMTVLSKLFAPVALGGSDGHADELEGHMATTLQRMKATVEG